MCANERERLSRSGFGGVLIAQLGGASVPAVGITAPAYVLPDASFKQTSATVPLGRRLGGQTTVFAFLRFSLKKPLQ